MPPPNSAVNNILDGTHRVGNLRKGHLNFHRNPYRPGSNMQLDWNGQHVQSWVFPEDLLQRQHMDSKLETTITEPPSRQ